MKRCGFVLAFLLMVFGAGDALAQHSFGVIGGFTFSTTNVKEINRGTATMFHVGGTYRLKLPHGFSVQPSLLYQVKGAKTEVALVNSDSRFGYVELPVSFQWGPDLLLFRPFVDVTPFVGYGVYNKFMSSGVTVKNNWDGLKRWEYGLGAGLGLEIWKFQLIARYNWNLGAITKDTTLSEIGKAFVGDANFGGVTLSLAFLF